MLKDTDKIRGLHEKARALTDSFFAEENARVLKELRAAQAAEEKRIEFREYLNIENDEILDALLELDVEPETLVAFALVPLVEVAWADGEIQAKERGAILKAAIEQGVTDGSPTYSLLDNWLQTPPSPLLFETWKGYIRELLASLGDRSRDHLKNSSLGRARAVAEAAGGFLGIASISAGERKMLEKLEQAFE